jgi:hypothetical protein
VNQGKNVYLYDQEGLTLYYSSKSFNQIKGDLGIHITTCKNCIKTGQLFLDFFKISDSPIEGATLIFLNLPYDKVREPTCT